MTLTLTRWSTLPDDMARATFVDRFQSCASDLSVEPHSGPATSSGYTAKVLRLAFQRPAELFVVWEDGTVVARAAGIPCTERAGAGVLGLYEAASGRSGDLATEMILDAAIQWAASQGFDELFAPVDLNTWFSYRFQVPSSEDAYAPPLASWEPRHPPEYTDRFRQHGFEDAEHYQTRGFRFPTSGTYTMSDVVRYGGTALEAAHAAGFRFQRLGDDVSVPTLLEELHPLCLEAFKENPTFESLSREVFQSLYHGALTRPEAHPTHWARNSEGRLVGFVYAFLEAGAMVVKTIAVDPAVRGKRLSTALFHLAAKPAADAGIHTFISALVRRANTSEHLGQPHLMPGVETWTRDYVLLRRTVSGPGDSQAAPVRPASSDPSTQTP